MWLLIWTEDAASSYFIHAFDSFYKPVTEAMASQDGEEILVRDPVKGFLKV
jgi:hypothetical protein